jgi:methylated-DNA-protein-cysteine methyltransferase related protein
MAFVLLVMAACPSALTIVAQLPFFSASILSLHSIIVLVLCRNCFALQQPSLYLTLLSSKFLLLAAAVVLTIEAACAKEVSGMSWDPVYRLVKLIPRGRVITYGALARALRLRGGARAAGRAMAATPSGKGIPWHRVLGERGKLLIREPYASLQRKLLESEGIALIESRVDLKRHLWAPSKPKSSHPRKKPITKRSAASR